MSYMRSCTVDKDLHMMVSTTGKSPRIDAFVAVVVVFRSGSNSCMACSSSPHIESKGIPNARMV